MFSLGFSVGPALGGVLAHHFGIRWALQVCQGTCQHCFAVFLYFV